MVRFVMLHDRLQYIDRVAEFPGSVEHISQAVICIPIVRTQFHRLAELNLGIA